MYMPRTMEVEKVTWADATLKPRELPKTVYKGLTLHLEMVTTNSTATITADTIAGAISKIEIVRNGQDTIVSIPGWMLFFMNKADFSIAPPSTIADTDGASKTQKVTLYLPFALTRSVNPEDTLLDARKASSLVMNITWATASAGCGTGTTITSGECQIQTDEYANVPADTKFARHEMTYIQEVMSATGQKNIDLDYGGMNQYKRLILFTRNSSDAYSDSEISAIAVRSRTFYYVKDDLERLYNRIVQFYSIAHDTGVYIIDFTRDGKMSQRLDARKLDELVLEITVATASGTIYVMKEKAIYAG